MAMTIVAAELSCRAFQLTTHSDHDTAMLPSQTARPSSSRSHMYRRPRSKRVPAIIIAVIAVVGVVMIYKWTRGPGNPTPAEASPPAINPTLVDSSTKSNEVIPASGASKSQLASAADPTPPARTLIGPPRSEPVEKISMGSLASASEGASLPSASLENAKPEAKGVTPPPATINPPPAAPASPPSGAPLSTAPAQARDTTMSAPPSASASQRVQAGFELLAQNKPIEARAMLSAAMLTESLSPADSDRIRTELAKLNERLVFSPQVQAGDPYASTYTIEAGDSLAKLPRKLGLNVDWRFLQRINNISSPERIQVGQRIKVVKGPFHAVIAKPDFRMDLFMGDFSNRVYVRSFKVGLGEHGATPEGEFIVKPNSKLINPAWTNPRTGERFAPNDPKNPLGEYWIGLIGVSDNIRDLESYGIHGTIDPASIGQLRSMGCVRMLADDIALVYELMLDNVSHVEIRGVDYP